MAETRTPPPNRAQRGVLVANKNIAARIGKLEAGRGRVASVIQRLVEDIDHLTEGVRTMKALPLPRKGRIGF